MFASKKIMAEIEPTSSRIASEMRITGMVISRRPPLCSGRFEGAIERIWSCTLPCRKFNDDVDAKSVNSVRLRKRTTKINTVQMVKHADFNGELYCDNEAVEDGVEDRAGFTRG